MEAPCPNPGQAPEPVLHPTNGSDLGSFQDSDVLYGTNYLEIVPGARMTAPGTRDMSLSRYTLPRENLVRTRGQSLLPVSTLSSFSGLRLLLLHLKRWSCVCTMRPSVFARSIHPLRGSRFLTMTIPTMNTPELSPQIRGSLVTCDWFIHYISDQTRLHFHDKVTVAVQCDHIRYGSQDVSFPDSK